MTAERARRILGVGPGADAAAVTRAYRAAVKQAHPDRGGDAERLQQVLEAHRLLLKLAGVRALLASAPAVPPKPKTRPKPKPRTLALRIGIEEAVLGARRGVATAGGRRLEVRLPPGVRPGQVLRLRAADEGSDLLLRIELEPAPGVTVRGSDIWLDVDAPATRLRRGQRLEVDTPRGRRALAAPKAIDGEALVRLKGEGLPARGPYPQGDLILRLKLAPDPKPGARELLKRFSARWAA